MRQFRPNPSRSLLSLLAVVLLGAGAPLVTLGQALAQTTRPKIQFVKPKLSRDRGAPGKRSEGASRSCLSEANGRSLTALVPTYDTVAGEEQVLGKTSQNQPELAFYLPVAAAEASSVRLSLLVLDESGNFLDEVAIATPEQAGIMRVTLPDVWDQIATTPGAVESNPTAPQRLNWVLEMEVICAGDDPADANYTTVLGWVERDPLPEEMAQAIAQSPPEVQAQRYAEQGLWFDALAIVATQLDQDPKDVGAIENWDALLSSVGLGDLTDTRRLPQSTPTAFPAMNDDRGCS